MNLPKYQTSVKKGAKGIRILSRIVEDEMNWILRPNHLEHDYGIDAYIDVITEKGQLSGKTIALQVKTGKSYFQEKNNFGWVYRDDLSHLNYYLNHDIPVVIVLVNDEINECFWCYCDPLQTENTGRNFKITVPFNQKLSPKSKVELLKYVSPIKDYVSQMEYFWEINKLIKSSERIFLSVDRKDIEDLRCDELVKGLERLHINKELMSYVKERIDIFINGYNEDTRELYEIEQVKTWVNFVFERVNGWGYFLSKDESSQFLKLLMLCNMEFVQIGECEETELFRKGRILELDLVSGVSLLENLFIDLNLFCQKHNIGMDINKEISANLGTYYMGQTSS